jgi:hypothetical protein
LTDKRIGIITFHAAHNYGAILQAYSLQQVIKSFGINNKIIDFRTQEQIDFTSYKTRRNGLKSTIKNLLLYKYRNEYRTRSEKLEFFINHQLDLTERFSSEIELPDCANRFDAFITGSDQVWNTLKKADYSPAYFLSFVPDNLKKIAYAVSIGNASKDDLIDSKKYIDKFDVLSFRESRGLAVINELIEKKAELVLDPTLLTETNIYLDLIKIVKKKFTDYIFYYSLDGYDKRDNNVEILLTLSRKLEKKIYALTPEWPKRVQGIENVIDVGIEEFLSLIYYADVVCTNSFHGTALSIALNKEFYVLEKFNPKDDRKSTLLNALNITDCMINSVQELSELHCNIDYTIINERLLSLKTKSLSFLKSSIETDKVII